MRVLEAVEGPLAAEVVAVHGKVSGLLRTIMCCEFPHDISLSKNSRIFDCHDSNPFIYCEYGEFLHVHS